MSPSHRALVIHGNYLSDRGLLVQWMQAFDELWVLGLGNDWAGNTFHTTNF